MNISLNTTKYLYFIDAKSLEKEQVFDYIDSINSSFSTSKNNWKNDTRFIDRKYIKNKNSTVFIIAKIAEEAIGYSIVRNATSEKDTSYLAFIAINKQYQQNGFGKKLLLETIIRTKSDTIILDCVDENIPFYENFAKSHGYLHTAIKHKKNANKFQFTIYVNKNETEQNTNFFHQYIFNPLKKTCSLI